MTDNVVGNYGWNDGGQPDSCSYLAPELLRLLSELDGAGKVVDVGFGNGSLCGYLTRFGLSCVGVEYDTKGYEICKSTYPELSFYNLGVQDDPALLVANEGLFDAVISTEVVEHLFSPQLLPIFAFKLLKPGGHLIVTTPYHGYLKNMAISVFNKWDQHHTALWHGGHIKFFSRKTLTILLEDNGFRDTRFSGVGRVAYLWKSMVLITKKE